MELKINLQDLILHFLNFFSVARMFGDFLFADCL